MHCSQEEHLWKTRLQKSRLGIQDRNDQTNTNQCKRSNTELGLSSQIVQWLLFNSLMYVCWESNSPISIAQTCKCESTKILTCLSPITAQFLRFQLAVILVYIVGIISFKIRTGHLQKLTMEMYQQLLERRNKKILKVSIFQSFPPSNSQRGRGFKDQCQERRNTAIHGSHHLGTKACLEVVCPPPSVPCHLNQCFTLFINKKLRILWGGFFSSIKSFTSCNDLRNITMCSLNYMV